MVSQYPIHTVLQLYSRGETHALSSGPSWGQYVNGAQSVNSMRYLNQCTLLVSMYVWMHHVYVDMNKHLKISPPIYFAVHGVAYIKQKF